MTQLMALTDINDNDIAQELVANAVLFNGNLTDKKNTQFGK